MNGVVEMGVCMRATNCRDDGPIFRFVHEVQNRVMQIDVDESRFTREELQELRVRVKVALPFGFESSR